MRYELEPMDLPRAFDRRRDDAHRARMRAMAALESRARKARRARRLALAIWLGYGACLAVVTYYAFTW